MGRWCLMKQQKNIINLKEMGKVLACQYTILVVQVIKAITSKERQPWWTNLSSLEVKLLTSAVCSIHRVFKKTEQI